eukprot:TRINITY_DN8665_c0_g1_i1.p1 TRINITY_DN8665_c0_g1~~TRINITY_DN8665_c0_g1_i1.p1  ORF type:complete len:462 (+),score=93.87 TRINITY_DN8665_c0_g1_i1:102-1487(+)
MDILEKLNKINENSWLSCGILWESMSEIEKALFCYKNVLRCNPVNIKALTQMATIFRVQERYQQSVQYFQKILQFDQANGAIWSALGHCFLLMEDLHKAYVAYQQALYHLPDPKDPTLWYGIGILYDSYGSYEHAERSFNAVLTIDPHFEKKNEIYFRLGNIAKQQQKYEESLKYYQHVLHNPDPISKIHIWLQIGNLYVLMNEYQRAKETYEMILKDNPNHAKTLTQFGWLYHQVPTLATEPDMDISMLERAKELDPNDGQIYYYLGRCFMAKEEYKQAYKAYQKAVVIDISNPAFWCSIGDLYYKINQYSDALDAYSRALQLNPYLPEVWHDLGRLYDSCGQKNDALDAYRKASELDPENSLIKQRIEKCTNEINSKPKNQNEANADLFEKLMNGNSNETKVIQSQVPTTLPSAPKVPVTIPNPTEDSNKMQIEEPEENNEASNGSPKEITNTMDVEKN